MNKPPAQPEVTGLLIAASKGDQQSYNKVFNLVYPELRRIAHRYMGQERHQQLQQTTGLIHDAYLKLQSLVGNTNIEWQERAQFYAIVARAMRRLLVDEARARQSHKRGEGEPHLSLDEVTDLLTQKQADHLVALDEALLLLARDNAEAVQVVELKYFGGYTYEEIADILGLSFATVRRRWKYAKARLFQTLKVEDAL